MKVIKGTPIASGIAKGMVCLYSNDVQGNVPHYSISGAQIEREKKRLEKALEKSVKETENMVELAKKQHDKNAVDIFEAHLMIVSDINLAKKANKIIEEKEINAEHAISDIFDAYIELYKSKEGHFKELAHDFVDARDRIISAFGQLGGHFKCPVGEMQPVIVAAKRLTPSMVLNIPREHALGFIAKEGGVTSHATIIARSYGVPIIFGIDAENLLNCGDTAILDGSLGKLFLDPDSKTVAYYEKKISEMKQKRAVCSIEKEKTPRTGFGKRIKLKVNISTPDEMELTKGLVTDGIGLLRTEFLFLSRDSLPSFDEQYNVYKNIFSYMGNKDIVVRLLDVSADKIPAYLTLPEHTDADLELRGAMAVETFPDIYVSQVKALLSAGFGYNLRLLYPMVSDLNDLKTFKDVLNTAKKELKHEKRPFNNRIPEGVMIETPSAVIMASELLKKIDFVNIGSNDLLQYTLAASRGNRLAEKRYHILHPSLAKLIEIVVKEGKKLKKEVCLCGEIASFEEYYPLLLDIGLLSFSVSVSKFPDIKCHLLHIQKEYDKKLINKFYKLNSKDEEDKFFLNFV